MKLPADWYPTDMGTSEDGYITVRKCYGSKGTYYLDCEVLEPVQYRGRTIQMAISEPRLSKKQLERGERNNYVWWIRKLLDTVFAEPTTLEDIGLSMTTVEQVNQTLLNLWCGAPTLTKEPT